MTPQAYRVGAVVYHEKVRQIWDAFGDWFSEQGLALQRFFDAYADQVRALMREELDTAWNTNLAYAHTLQLTDGGAHAIAMRDTDLGWRSHIVAREDDGHHGLADLQGARVGFGNADSPLWLIGAVAGAIWWARGIEARGLSLEALAQPS